MTGKGRTGHGDTESWLWLLLPSEELTQLLDHLPHQDLIRSQQDTTQISYWTPQKHTRTSQPNCKISKIYSIFTKRSVDREIEQLLRNTTVSQVQF